LLNNCDFWLWWVDKSMLSKDWLVETNSSALRDLLLVLDPLLNVGALFHNNQTKIIRFKCNFFVMQSSG
jgi:hypothetical protein